MRQPDAFAFTLGTYLRDRWFCLALTALCMLALAAFGAILGVTGDGLVVLCSLVFLCAATAMAIDYLRRRHFWRQVIKLMEAVEDPAQFASLLEEPAFLEGKLAYAMTERIQGLGNAELTAARMEGADYREYIELWIHEAKTPIAAAKLIASRMHGSEADSLALELEQVERQVEQALYYARSTSLANDYSLRDVSLAAVVREACKRQARFLIERQTIPAVNIPDSVRVLADPPWLIFMLGQIVINSAQYGAAHIDFTSTEEDAGTSHGRTLLVISDDGCGIAESDVPRVFDRGFTGSNGRRSGTATGMGLHLVANMCARLGLGVTLTSEEGCGTQITLVFPHDRRRLAK